jgi:hypothetical protein
VEINRGVCEPIKETSVDAGRGIVASSKRVGDMRKWTRIRTVHLDLIRQSEPNEKAEKDHWRGPNDRPAVAQLSVII